MHGEELLTRVPLGETHGLHGSLRRDVDWVAGINGNPKATKVSELIFVALGVPISPNALHCTPAQRGFPAIPASHL